MTRKLAMSVCALSAIAISLTACSTASADKTAEESNNTAEVERIVFEHPTLAGKTITVDETPTNIVMDCYSYSSLADYGLKPVALYGFDCDNPNVMGDLDISGFETVGQQAEIDVEKLASLRPDIIIGHGNAEGPSWLDEDVKAQLERVAEFVALPQGETVDESISATRKVAEFLGGDVTSSDIQEADKALEDAKAKLAQVAEEKDLSVMLASPTKEMLYTAVGFKEADLLEELGTTIVGAPAPAEGNPWGKIAWEEASAYETDVILSEDQGLARSFDGELWQSMPAVAKGQIAGWGSKGKQTSANYAAWLNELSEKFEEFEKLN